MCTTYYSLFLACNHKYPDPGIPPNFCSGAGHANGHLVTCAHVTHLRKYKIHGLCPPCAYEAVKREKYEQEERECEAAMRFEEQERRAREERTRLGTSGAGESDDSSIERGKKLKENTDDGCELGTDEEMTEYLHLLIEKELRKSKSGGKRECEVNEDAEMAGLLQVAIDKAFMRAERGSRL